MDSGALSRNPYFTVVAYDDSVHGKDLLSAVLEVWTKQNTVALALRVDADAYKSTAVQMVECASNSIPGSRGCSYVSIDSDGTIVAFQIAFTVQRPVSHTDVDFDCAMTKVSLSMSTWGIFLRSAAIVIESQASAIFPVIGLQTPPMYIRVALGGALVRVEKQGAFKAISLRFWKDLFRSVADGGPPIVAFSVATHPITIRNSLAQHYLGETLLTLGSARSIADSAPVDLDGVASSIAFASAVKAAGSSLNPKLERESHWRMSAIHMRSPRGTRSPVVHMYTLIIRFDMRSLFGSLHEGFRTWPIGDEFAPVAFIAILALPSQVQLGQFNGGHPPPASLSDSFVNASTISPKL